MSLSVIIRDWLVAMGIDNSWAEKIDLPVTIALLLLFAYSVDFFLNVFLLKYVKKIVIKTRTEWDDVLLEKGVINNFCRMVAPIIIYKSIDTIDEEFSQNVIHLMKVVCSLYILVTALLLVNAVFKSIYHFFNSKDRYRQRPLKGLLQTAQVLLWIIGVILAISIITGRSPLLLLTGIGASAAVLILVFKDSILGLVSGVQLSANQMLQVGDWITVPNYGADGTVLEVTLNTVKVQNWDNTIVTVPPYALITGSFQNWKGMQESGGRRIKRSINIDMHSVSFCSPEMLEKYKKIELVREYIERTEKEIEMYNKNHSVDVSVPANGLRQTNLGIFRAYLNAYLNNLNVVNKDLTCMVRQLQPTDVGIPIELYFFSAIKEWVAYEGIQSDVFDHVLAVIPEFDLSVFQLPTSMDIRSFLEK